MRELEPGSVFAGHRIEAVTGRGGMGWVYRARHLALDRVVALKVIAPDLVEDATIRERFLRESKVAASIDHPNVIPIYYAGEDDGVAYLAMRYVAGDDLRSLVRRERRLEPARAAQITEQVGQALDAAHGAGLVHRDVKPANVLLGARDHVYLTDFGLTKHALSMTGDTGTGQWVGTLDYVSPEQIRGERVDARTDVYALGCLLFFALTGAVAFKRDGDEAKLWAHLTEAPPKPSELAEGVDPVFDGVIARALAKEPAERYQSAGNLGSAACAAAAGEPWEGAERIVARGQAAPMDERATAAGRTFTVATRLQAPEEEKAPTGAAATKRHLAAALLAGLVLGGAAIGVAMSGGDDDPPAGAAATPTATATTAELPAVGRVYDVTNRPRERPSGMAIDDGVAWLIYFNSDRVDRVDLASGKVRAGPRVGRGAADIVTARDKVWVAVSRDRRVVRIDARTGEVERRHATPGRVRNIAVAGGSVWVSESPRERRASEHLVELDAGTLEERRRMPVPEGIRDFTRTPRGSFWVASRHRSRAVRYDARGAQTATVGLAGQGWDVTYARGHLWVVMPREDLVARYDAQGDAPVTIGVDRQPRQALVVGRTVWVTTNLANAVVRIDADSGKVVGTPIPVGLNPHALDAWDGSVWVAGTADGTLTQVIYRP